MGDEVKNFLDLRGVACPMNFVRVKLAMEELSAGDCIEVELDEGDAMLNVPRSLKAEGHRIRQVVSLGEHYRLCIEKGVGGDGG